MNPYFYFFGKPLFTVNGQIVLKWRLSPFGILPAGAKEKALFVSFIFSGFTAAFPASICWMAAMAPFEITQAYAFMSLVLILVFLTGILFLGETFAIGKGIVLLLILLGIFITVNY